MNINEAFPSKWLKAGDLQNRQVTVTIDHVASEDIGDENKIVVYFQGKEKGLVLNKTNAGTIAGFCGDDTDQWHGQRITLFPTKVAYNGQMVAAIRIMPAPQVVQPPAATRKPTPAADNSEPAQTDDNIPF